MGFLRYIISFTMLLSFVSTNKVTAQGCCSGGTPLSGNLDLASSDAKNLSIRITYDHNNLGDVVFKSKELEDKSRTRITNATLLRLDYTFNDWLAVNAIFSYVGQEERIQFNNVDNSTLAKGFGDIVLMLQYNALKKNDSSLAIAGGVKAPTGAIDRTNETTGLLLNPDLQPGTGAWDFLAVSHYSQRNFLINFLNFRFGLSYRITNEADRFNQQQKYRFGNEFQANTGFNYQIFIRKTQIVPQLVVRYRNTKVDLTNGFESPNTGGHWLYLVPGFETYFSSNVGFGVLAELPLYRRLEGIQLTTSYKITASVFYSLSLEKKKKEADYKKVFD